MTQKRTVTAVICQACGTPIPIDRGSDEPDTCTCPWAEPVGKLRLLELLEEELERGARQRKWTETWQEIATMKTASHAR